VAGPKIFLNYRREDTRGYAGRLYDRLSNRFGEEQIFRDVDAIPPGIDFLEHIDGVVDQCDLMLVLIGESWTSIKDAQGKRRLYDPHDFVSIEIAAALEKNIPVIPVLIQGARMPSKEDLPEHIQSLARRNAVEMSDSHWNYDWERLTRGIDQLTSRPVSRDRPARPGNGAGQPAQAVSERPPGPARADAPSERGGARRPLGRRVKVALLVIPLIMLLAAGSLVIRRTGSRPDGDKQRPASATSSTGAGPGPTTTSPSPMSFNATERQLLGHVGAAMRASCERAPKRLTGAIAAVRCFGNDLPSVQYNLFRSKTVMTRLFSSRAKAVGAHTGPCKTTQPHQKHVDKAMHQEQQVGRLLCYTTRGEARLEWTNERLKIYTFSYSKIMTTHSMYHEVYMHAGPHPMRHGG
jgi:TIR domain